MSKTVKIVIAVIAVAAIAFGVYKWYSSRKKDAKVVPLTQPADKAA